MVNEIKDWKVVYDHKDGRSGTTGVTTEIHKSGGFQYGNGKAGSITVDGNTRSYDLRYESGDFHMLMLKDYFGDGLVKATEVDVIKTAKNTKKDSYLKRLEEAACGAELDHITLVAAYDNEITNKDYKEIYDFGEKRLKEIYGWE